MFSIAHTPVRTLVVAAALAVAVLVGGEPAVAQDGHHPPAPPSDPAPAPPSDPAPEAPAQDPAAGGGSVAPLRGEDDPSTASLEQIQATIADILAREAYQRETNPDRYRETATWWMDLKLKWGTAFSNRVRNENRTPPSCGGPSVWDYGAEVIVEVGKTGYELFRRMSPLATAAAGAGAATRFGANVYYGNPWFQGVLDEFTSQGVGLVAAEQITGITTLWKTQRSAGASVAESIYVVGGVKLGELTGFTPLMETIEGTTVYGEDLKGLDRVARGSAAAAGLAGTILGATAVAPSIASRCAGTTLRLPNAPGARHPLAAQVFDADGRSIATQTMVSGRAGAQAVLGAKLPRLGRFHTEFTGTVWANRYGNARVLRMIGARDPCPICFNRLRSYARMFDVIVVYEGPSGTIVFFPGLRLNAAGVGLSAARAAALSLIGNLMLLQDGRRDVAPGGEDGKPPWICGTPGIDDPRRPWRPPAMTLEPRRPNARDFSVPVAGAVVHVRVIDSDGDGQPDRILIDWDGDGEFDSTHDFRSGSGGCIPGP